MADGSRFTSICRPIPQLNEESDTVSQSDSPSVAPTNSAPSIVMYGADWCPDCVRSKAYLDGRGVSYTYVDLEAFPEHDETVKSYNGGNRPIPTIVFADGSHLAEPSDEELGAKLDLV